MPQPSLPPDAAAGVVRGLYRVDAGRAPQRANAGAAVPDTSEPGYYAVFFEDPDRIKLEVVHVPPRAH